MRHNASCEYGRRGGRRCLVLDGVHLPLYRFVDAMETQRPMQEWFEPFHFGTLTITVPQSPNDVTS